MSKTAPTNNSHWWFELLHQGPLANWMLIAVSSASRAQTQQSLAQNFGATFDTLPNLGDTKEKRKWLSLQVEQNPDAMMDYWVLIQREIYNDLLDGKNAFARNLADKRKQCIEAVESARESLRAGDETTFNDSMNQLFSNEPGRYAGEIERLIVGHWVTRPEPDLPPFCCWKDESLASYLSERSGKPNDWSKNFIEDRRRSLGLLKVPAYIVVEWRRGTDGSRGKPIFDLDLRDNPQLDRDAFNWICGQLTYDVFYDAFGSRTDEFTQHALAFLRFPISDTLKQNLSMRLESIQKESSENRIRIPLPNRSKKADSRE